MMESINEYCLRDVFKLIEFRDQVALRRVSWTWFRVLDEILSLTEQFHLIGAASQKTNETIASAALVVRQHFRTSNQWKDAVTRTIVPLLSRFSSLRSLTIDCHGHTFSDRLTRTIVNSCPNLSTLTITNAVHLSSNLSSITSLRNLSLKCAYFASPDEMVIFLKTANIDCLAITDSDSDLTTEVVAAIKSNVSQFKLDCPFTGLSAINGLVTPTIRTRLTRLDLQHITNQQLRVICSKMLRLKGLSFRSSIVDLTPLMRLVKLEELMFACQGLRTENDEQTLGQLFGSLPQLETISVEWPRAPPSIVELAVSRCPKLTRIVISSVSTHRIRHSKNSSLIVALNEMRN